MCINIHPSTKITTVKKRKLTWIPSIHCIARLASKGFNLGLIRDLESLLGQTPLGRRIAVSDGDSTLVGVRIDDFKLKLITGYNNHEQVSLPLAKLMQEIAISYTEVEAYHAR
jgi:hypothetical protein